MKQYIGISRDHSRSMTGLNDVAANDYNANIASIKSEAAKHGIDTIVSVVKCGVGWRGTVEREVTNSNVNVLTPISSRSYITDGGSTPLFDSIGELIDQFASVPDAKDPDVSFLIMIITDGQENSSRLWNARTISQRIKELQATDRWTFIFRVPRGDKYQLMQYGIPEHNILEWEQTTKGLEAATVATTRGFSDYYSARASGLTSTSKFYADLSTVTIKEVKQSLVDISSQVTLIPVTIDGIAIKTFIENATHRPLVKGSTFYQLTKTEEVQDYKQIAIRDKLKGTVYAGAAARDMLGLPLSGTVKLAPGNHGQYDIFVQSTSVNRKLVANTLAMVWYNAV